MIITTATFATPVVSLVGAFIFWANPARRVNQTVFVGALVTTAWLVFWHLAVITAPAGLLWLRWTCSAGAVVPLSFWIVRAAILGQFNGFLDFRWALRNWPWLIITLAVAVIPFTDAFIPASSTDSNRLYGWGYYFYMTADFSLYAVLLVAAVRSRLAITGSKALELQLWLGGGCSMFIAVWMLSALSTWTADPIFRRLMPMAVLIFYTGAAVLITIHRIFDARYLFRIGLQRCVLIALVGAMGYLMVFGLKTVMPLPLALFLTTGFALWFATKIEGGLDQLFNLYPNAVSVRQAAFAITRRELRLEEIEQSFLVLLKGWGQTEHAMILTGVKGSLTGGGINLADDCSAVEGMRHLRWATPERLARERPTPDREAVAKFLAENGLGALVIGEGPTLTTLVGVGVPAARRPFTYPQITQLIELASIIEGALERAHFSVKAQHAEQLATVGLLGASLAHEIRNPLVTIKTFVQLLPRHHQDETFRQKFFGLIGEEVTRIDRLTEQLLDLASPRAYHAETIELHPVLNSSIELVAAKATDKRIKFLTDFRAAPDQAFTDASAARQVLLNLCFNAIQAVETIEGERWVRVSTRNVGGGIEMRVEDSGPGIAEDIRPRLFQPFQSNKSSGFGLGLAICSDILSSLDATISVDPASPGQGASFRVVFPAAATAPATGNAAKPPGRAERVRAINAYP